MVLSVFEIFKIGVGPSSSHTMGPMLAATRFVALLRDGRPEPGAGAPATLRAWLQGSLAFTGRGHATDRAVALGLLGFEPATLEADRAEAALAALEGGAPIVHDGLAPLAFDPSADIVFDYDAAPPHPNTLILRAFDARGLLAMEESYCSVGGGFVLTARQFAEGESAEAGGGAAAPFAFESAEAMLAMAARSGLSIAAMMRANERARGLSEAALEDGLAKIWAVMKASMDRGLSREGVLPGGLNVRRRAPAIRRSLEADRGRNDAPPHHINDWISVYAMAVNEENAAGGQVVTAPTNGAAGALPAVLRYYLDHAPGASDAHVGDFLLTAAAIGGLIKRNASISGAECGCQAEVGSAAAMAAAGLCAALGGAPAQVENAAEIALEHHLGMTCDPVAGLVQVPCIERNGLGAVKAVAAASLALRGDGAHFMPLDNCIEAMRQTGRDMSEKYKETSQGGLAVNLPEC